eukprot:gene9009-18649_t
MLSVLLKCRCQKKIPAIARFSSTAPTVYSHRGERLERRLEHLLTREIRKGYKKIEKSPENNRLESLKSLMESRGFTNIVDNRGYATVNVSKVISNTNTNTEDIDASEPPKQINIAIEFEYRTRKDDEMKLFDIIQTIGDGSSGSLVFTCDSAPEFQIMSVRIIPPGVNYLNQDVYDGPNLSILPQDIQRDLVQHLEAMGIDPDTAKFIEAYGYRKHHLDRLWALENILNFIKTSPAAAASSSSPSE